MRELDNKRRVGLRRTVFALVVCLVWLLGATPLFALTPAYNESGDPQGWVTGWFKWETGSGTNAENYANYHACVAPAYDPPSTWYEIDGTLTNNTGGSAPTWVTASSTDIPSIDFTRSQGTAVDVPEDSSSCTSGQGKHPWVPVARTGFTGTAQVITAWIKPEYTPVCADVGKIYTIVSKWDTANSVSSSYRLYLQVDQNKASCSSSADVDYHLYFEWNDSGATFTPPTTRCVKSQNTSNHYTDQAITPSVWTHVGVEFKTAGAAQLNLFFNGMQFTPTGTAETQCDSGTTITAGTTEDLGTGLNLLLGSGYTSTNSAGTRYTDGFEGKLGPVWFVDKGVFGSNNSPANSTSSYSANMMLLDHLDGNLANNATGGSGPFAVYGINNSGSFQNTVKRWGKAWQGGNSKYIEYINPIFNHADSGTEIQAMTAEAWVRYATSVTTATSTIISKWKYSDAGTCTTTDTTNSNFHLYTTGSPPKAVFQVLDSASTSYTATGATTIAPDVWYHVAGQVTETGKVQFLTGNTVYIMLNGQSDGTVAFHATNPVKRTGSGALLVGADSCATGQANYLGNSGTAYVDEVRVQVWDHLDNYSASPKYMREYHNPGIYINEVNIYGTTDNAANPAEYVELSIPADLGRTIDMNGYVLKKSTLQTTGCYKMATAVSKTVDPGDFPVIRLGAGTDTSCSGAATTCDWYTNNGAAACGLRLTEIAGTNFTFSNTGGNVWLYAPTSATPNNDNQAFAAAVDFIGYGPNANTIVTAWQNIGFWTETDPTNTSGVSISALSPVTGYTIQRTQDVANGGVNDGFTGPATAGSSNGSGTTAVELTSFTATQFGPQTQVAWSTGTEHNTFGFEIERAEFIGEPFTTVSDLILARGDGSDYEWIDYNANDNAYYYRLREIENSGNINYYGPVHAAPLDTVSSKGDQGSANSSNNPLGEQSEPAVAAGGCGRIALNEEFAPATLSLFMLLIVFLIRRTQYLESWFSRRGS